jgi:hypothetical protein
MAWSSSLIEAARLFGGTPDRKGSEVRLEGRNLMALCRLDPYHRQGLYPVGVGG